MIKYVLIFCLTTSHAFAIDIEEIKEGQPAPKDGFFVDAENMKKFRKINEEKKLLETKVAKLEDLSVVRNNQIQLYKNLNNSLESELAWENFKGDMKGVGGFLLGVLATSAATYVAIEVVE